MKRLILAVLVVVGCDIVERKSVQCDCKCPPSQSSHSVRGGGAVLNVYEGCPDHVTDSTEIISMRSIYDDGFRDGYSKGCISQSCSVACDVTTTAEEVVSRAIDGATSILGLEIPSLDSVYIENGWIGTLYLDGWYGPVVVDGKTVDLTPKPESKETLKDKWRKIIRGNGPGHVREYIGEPDRIVGDVWHYPFGGRVTFGGRNAWVTSWEEPVWQPVKENHNDIE
jgi:hypothetical protein